jgi:DNA-binding transcriptional LysR family regulator
MELEQMEAFLAVADTKSFTRSAEQLHVAQTTVTARIKALEEKLGKTLFERTSRHVELSAAGLVLYPYVQRVLELVQEGETATRIEGQFAERLVVGSVHSLWDHMLFPLVERFRDGHPQVALRLITGHSGDIVKKMLDGLIDIGVVYVPPNLSEIEVVPLYTDTIHLVARPELVQGDLPLTPDDLHRLPYIHLNWGPPFDEWYAEEVGKNLHAFQVDHTSLFLKFLLHGEGIGFLPEEVAAEFLADGRLQKVPFTAGAPLPERAVYLIYPKRKKISGAIAAWIDLLKQPRW